MPSLSVTAIHSGHIEEWLERWLPAPLYESETGTTDLLIQVANLRAFSDKFETHCPECEKDSIFHAMGDESAAARLRQIRMDARTGDETWGLTWASPFKVELTCSRHEFHIIRLYFEVTDSLTPGGGRTYRLTKVGQWPSLLDFRLHELQGLEGAFSKAVAREWRRSIVTAAHGFSVAACVHLRRALEGVLIEARDTADGGAYAGKEWAKFDSGTMPDRIRLVAAELPALLVDHPHLYGILSKGVHQLDEHECAEEMPILQRAMRLIARQTLERKARSKEAAEVRELLLAAHARHASPGREQSGRKKGQA